MVPLLVPRFFLFSCCCCFGLPFFFLFFFRPPLEVSLMVAGRGTREQAKINERYPSLFGEKKKCNNQNPEQGRLPKYQGVFSRLEKKKPSKENPTGCKLAYYPNVSSHPPSPSTGTHPHTQAVNKRREEGRTMYFAAYSTIHSTSAARLGTCRARLEGNRISPS